MFRPFSLLLAGAALLWTSAPISAQTIILGPRSGVHIGPHGDVHVDLSDIKIHLGARAKVWLRPYPRYHSHFHAVPPVMPAPLPQPAPTVPAPFVPTPTLPAPTPTVPGPISPLPNQPEPLPVIPQVVPGPQITPTQVHALTHYQFARAFRPIPGTHSVMLIHPRTGRPCQVTFRLPAGTPHVEVERDALIFDYEELVVEIEFRGRGRVRVYYDD